MAKVLNFKVVIEQDYKGFFIADTLSIPGCHTQGKTYEEVLKNIREAIKLCLEVAEKDKSYKAKIDFEEAKRNQRFVGVTQVDVVV